MAGWKLVPFEDVVRSRGSGASGLPTSEWQNSGAYPVIGQGAQEIEGWTDRSDLVLSFSSGVVLYGGHTRRAKHVERPFVPGPNVKILEPVQGLDSRFLFHYLTHLPIESKGYADHFPLVRKASVPVPPEGEQRRIVVILDEAFEAITTAKANTEKNLQNAREVFRSNREKLLAGAALGWASAPLSDLCEIKHGYAFEGEFFAAEGDFVLLTPGNFYETGGYRDRGEKQKYFVGPIPKDFVLFEGDLLVAMTEQAAGLLGSPLLVPESGRFLHNQRLGLVVGKPEAIWCNAFFFHVFNLDRVRTEIHASASGVKVRHTSPSKIGAVQVSFPTSEAEQLAIASAIEELAAKCKELASIHQQKLAALDELKMSLLHQAFTGQLNTKATDKQLAEVA